MQHWGYISTEAWGKCNISICCYATNLLRNNLDIQVASSRQTVKAIEIPVYNSMVMATKKHWILAWSPTGRIGCGGRTVEIDPGFRRSVREKPDWYSPRLAKQYGVNWPEQTANLVVVDKNQLLPLNARFLRKVVQIPDNPRTSWNVTRAC